MFSFKIDCITLDPDSDPNWAKILDTDPNSIYLDPQHWYSMNGSYPWICMKLAFRSKFPIPAIPLLGNFGEIL